MTDKLGTAPFAVTNAMLDEQKTVLRVANGLIAAMGPEVTPEPADQVLDAGGKPLVRGLVNGHTHAAMTLLRGLGDDVPLIEWLTTRIWPAERRLTADDVYWGTRLACVEMIRSGTVAFWDMYWYQFDVARAVVDSGMRAVVGQPIMELDKAPEGARPQDAADGIAHLGEFGSRVGGALTPHAIYTVSEPSLRLVAELAAETRVPVHIHLAETEQEVADCVREHGMRTADYLDSLGLLHERVVLAHGVWLEDHELALIEERGATIVTNPSSNMKLAVGRAFPYPAAHDAGVHIGLGTDGAASNNSLDLLAEMKVLTLLQKHASRDPSVLPAAIAWEIATGAHAPLLGAKPLAVGQPADFLLINANVEELTPGPLLDNLVYAASGSVVDTVVIDGRILMQGRVIDGEADVRAHARECAGRVRHGIE